MSYDAYRSPRFQNSIAIALSAGATNTVPIANPQTVQTSLEAEVDYALVAPTFATVAGWLSVLSSGFLVHLCYLETRTMFQFSDADAGASSVCATQLSASPLSLPRPRYETVRHMLYGSRAAVQNTIYTLHHLDYAEPNDWTKPVPTGQPNEVVAVLIKRVRV